MAEDSLHFRCIPVCATHGPEGIIDKQLKVNAIRTTKYTLLNWLPKSILEQFRRVANAYFLGISVLMILGSYATYLFISPLDPFSTIATLTVILLITSCKEGYEDLLRRRSDKYENNKEVTVVTFEHDSASSGHIIVREHTKRSKYLHPGEIVKLSGKMPAPADLLLILTSMHSDGNKCYVETANIDGETNLKLREAPAALTTELVELIAEGAPVLPLFQGSVEIETPNANIHKVVGTLKLEAAKHPIPIDAQNIVLRSALFSNTNWAYGIVVYAGQETKIQMNSLHAPSKMSKLEQNLNTAIIIIFIAQVVLVSISVLSVYLLGFDDTNQLPYVFPPGTGSGSILPLWLELWFVFFLLYNNFIPLSLYVTIEIVNLGQSFLIGADELLYNAALDVPCTVRASNLVQELGMVSNVFTDKTGTLTCNEMKLVKFVLNGRIYNVRTPSAPATPVGECVDVNVASISATEPVDVVMEEARVGFCTENGEVGAGEANVAKSSSVNTSSGMSISGEYKGKLSTQAPGSAKRKQIIRLQRTDSFSSDSSAEETSTATTAPVQIPTSSSKRAPTVTTSAAHAANNTATCITDPDNSELFAFLRGLMTCHTVVRESNGTYRAESPDELALVQGAVSYDCQLLHRGSRDMSVQIMSRAHTYTILAVNVFNSERKRMSVLLRDTETDEYLVVCKGADNIMLPLCNISSAEQAQVDRSLLELANLGLRTLVIAQRVITAVEAKRWLKQHRSSTVATLNREALIAAAGAELEQSMQMVGVTAIEDKLQDEVPEVISDLTKAGIIVWMLTGDKLETAVNIGHSCNLLQPDSNTVTIANMASHEEFASALQAEHAKLVAAHANSLDNNTSVNNCTSGGGAADGANSISTAGERIATRMRRSISNVTMSAQANIEAVRNTVLVLDGPSFSYFDTDNPAQCMQLLEIGRLCRSVIACRLTPMQKRELVALTKNDTSVTPRATTLSIGDGANDVSMILEANVGVGIFGKEGRQAANNADFAIGEFKLLRRLLLVHGRSNYIRQSKVFLYSMHKNMVLTMTLFWFSFFTAVSGASPYESWVYSGFNFILGLPIIYYGILDRDLSPEFVAKYPYVYSTGRLNVLLNVGSILQWIGNAMAYAVVVCLMYYNILYPTFYFMGLYTAGTTVMIGLVLALQFKVMFFHHQWAYPQVDAMLFSFFGMFLYYMLIAVAVDDYWNEAIMTYRESIMWLWSLLTVPLTAIFIDWLAYFIRFLWFPTREMLYREFEQQDVFDDLNRLSCSSAGSRHKHKDTNNFSSIIGGQQGQAQSVEEAFPAQAGLELVRPKPKPSTSGSGGSAGTANSSGASPDAGSPTVQYASNYNAHSPSSPYGYTDNPSAGSAMAVDGAGGVSIVRQALHSQFESSVAGGDGLRAGSADAGDIGREGLPLPSSPKCSTTSNSGSSSKPSSRPSSALLSAAQAAALSPSPGTSPTNSSSVRRNSKSGKVQPNFGFTKEVVPVEDIGIRGAEHV